MLTVTGGPRAVLTQDPTENLYAVEWTCRHCGRHCVSTGQLAQKPAQKPKPIRINVVCPHCQQPKSLYFHEVVLEDTVETHKRDGGRRLSSDTKPLD
jgi:hypothetical protein